MTAIVDRVLRDFNRYTGDGNPNPPVGAPLPVGDPTSGVYEPKKADLRAALNDVVQLAESSAAQAAINGRAHLAQFASIATELGYAGSGRAVIVAAGYRFYVNGVEYEVIATGASGADLDYTGSGGIKAIVLGEGGVVQLRGFGPDLTGAVAADALVTAALARIPAAGGRLAMPTGTVRTVAPVVVPIENVKLQGPGPKAAEIAVAHTGIGLTFTGQSINLPNCRMDVENLRLTKSGGNALDANGFPQAGWSGTGVELKAAFCNTVEGLFVERFETGLSLLSHYMGVYTNFTARNCWWGLKCGAFGPNGPTTGVTFMGGVFNNSAFDLTGGEKFTFMGTDFEASSQTCIISTRNVFKNCRFERMHISRAFFTWLRIVNNFNRIEGSQFFWDASTFVGNAATDFYVRIEGAFNTLEMQKIFTHQNAVLLDTASTGNVLTFNAPFTDYANTGNNALYRRSGRLFIDKGTRNTIRFENGDGFVESIGSQSLSAQGNLSNLMRYDSMSNLVINAGSLTITQSDIAGPMGLPASHVDVKKFTVAATPNPIRARTPTLATGNGTQVYSLGCYVWLTGGGTQVTRVRIGDGSGTFFDIYPGDGVGKWHWVPFFTQPANGEDVQFMIDAEGDIGDVFYVALPSCSLGNLPVYVPPPRGKTSWTVPTLASSVTTADVQAMFGADETGVDYVPAFAGFTGSVTAAAGRYTKRGDMVDVTVRLTGTSFSAALGAASVAMPLAGGDGSLTVSNTDSASNLGVGLVANGTAFLPAITATNSLTLYASYRLANV